MIPTAVSLPRQAPLGVFLAIGLIVGGWVLGAQIKATRLSDRYVAVKGLVERKVKSDLAIWPLSCKEAGDDLSVVYAKTEADKAVDPPVSRSAGHPRFRNRTRHGSGWWIRRLTSAVV